MPTVSVAMKQALSFVEDAWLAEELAVPLPGTKYLGSNNVAGAVSQEVPQVRLGIRHLQACAQGDATMETDGIALLLAPNGLPKAHRSLVAVVRFDGGVMATKQVCGASGRWYRILLVRSVLVAGPRVLVGAVSVGRATTAAPARSAVTAGIDMGDVRKGFGGSEMALEPTIHRHLWTRPPFCKRMSLSVPKSQ